MSVKKIRLGIVGACGRGASFKAACDALPEVTVAAVCDVRKEGLAKAAEALGAQQQYTDYAVMLEKADLDAVIVGTPMPWHVPQAVAALSRGIHVLSEVPAGVNLEECMELVMACHESKAVYMMAENYIYHKPNIIVREMARQGLFGTLYFADGEYIHELKHLNEQTPWRRRWQTGINGNTYPTHSLGPILQWMRGDRVTAVCCVGSGHHYPDPRGDKYENEDVTLTLCRMAGGGLVKLRLDMLSERPHAMTNYQLQGTEGCYESARAPGEIDRVWVRSHGKNGGGWRNLTEFEAEFLPKSWRKAENAAASSGHGGGDYFEMVDFVDAVLGKRPATIGIHEAMDLTLPGLMSQQSIAQGGVWVDVPDSRQWQKTPPRK